MCVRKNERKIVSDCSAVVVGWFEWSDQRRPGIEGDLIPTVASTIPSCSMRHEYYGVVT